MICKHCGNDIKVGTAFCLECGKPITQKKLHIYDKYSNLDFKNQSFIGFLLGIMIWVVLTYIITIVKGSYDPFNIIVALLLSISFALIWDSIITYRKGKATLGWPTVQGTVVYARIKESYGRRSKGKEPYRYAMIIFEYIIKGQNYLCNQIRITHGRRYHYSEVEIYPEMKDVTVFYNPDKHKNNPKSSEIINTHEALLEPGYPFFKTIIWMISGLFTLIISFLIYQNIDKIQSINQS